MFGIGLCDDIIIAQLRADNQRLQSRVAEAEMETARAKFELNLLKQKKVKLKYNWQTGKAELIGKE